MQKRWVLKMMLSIVLCMSLLFSATPVSAVDVESENYEGEMIEAVALTADNIPEVISAASIEENNHIARIFSEEKDMNSIVFLNDDDTATLYYFEEAVNSSMRMGISKIKATSYIVPLMIHSLH